eukprot:scaffold2767_cov177-Amphora_coffeaeformis.AAC.59
MSEDQKYVSYYYGILWRSSSEKSKLEMTLAKMSAHLSTDGAGASSAILQIASRTASTNTNGAEAFLSRLSLLFILLRLKKRFGQR